MPELPTERARRAAAGAAEAGGPLVLARAAGGARVVERVCPRARALGLRPGLSLAQARALVPGLTVASYEPHRDRVVLVHLARWAYRFSPAVEPVEPGTLLLDITGCQRLFGGEEAIARQAVTGLARRGFQARGAVADTVGAAYALAVAGPAPLGVVPPGQASAWLAPLSPAALRIAPTVVEKLDAVGIRSIGDLLMLPRSTLPARFGTELVLRLQQALGEVWEGVTPQPPAEPPHARRSFESPLTDYGSIVAVVERLLAEVLSPLRARALAARRVECVLYYERAAPRLLAVGLSRATHDHRHVAELLRQRLEQVDLNRYSGSWGANREGGPPGEPRLGRSLALPCRTTVNTHLAAGVVGVALIARQVSRCPGQQGGLFEPPRTGAGEALGNLIDRLAARLGHETLVRPRLLDDHQPERAFRYASVADAGCEPESNGDVPSARPLARRPVRLLPRPVLTRAVAERPGGPPMLFVYRGREYRVVWAEGPERLETGWWRGPDIRRDYYRVVTDTGEQFWLFRVFDRRVRVGGADLNAPRQQALLPVALAGASRSDFRVSAPANGLHARGHSTGHWAVRPGPMSNGLGEPQWFVHGIFG